MNLNEETAQTVKWISNIGADPKGGTTRLLYSEAWVEAQNGIKRKLEELGMQTRFDAIGNLFGRLPGTKYPDETILTGSHIDTVVNGGKLDGQYGVIASYLAVKLLKEKYGQPLRNLEVISMAEEEGSRFPYAFWGSKNLVLDAKREDVETIADFEGIKFVDAMHAAGFDFRKEDEKLREDIKAFIEIHIEQGNVLETEKKSVGVVTSIVGQKRYTVILKGQANHAGTTPMGLRKDAIYAFSKIVTQSIGKAEKVGDPLVLTFGKVEPTPNTVNVVPGEVLFTIDCRHTDQEELNQFTQEIETDMKKIAADMGMELSIDLWMDEAPVPMDEKIVGVLKEVVEKEAINYRIMHSGAGHDSQIIAPHIPTAMLFVPSIGGISHNPAEDTKVEDLAEGVKTLAAALYELAYTE
ncbi:allantoate deiminase [Carnobacterium sp. CS13]|uniref:allantoate deiminase n=1 Tax=Carnobacterium sp. CS13 TaxID=2800128 RepID=UPI001914A131|nr:allantoate deiminase [Carnobacterium sp. CS13]QQP69445.1 allantoate deiminase [Carnobacterium sp. CS13]